MSALNIYLFGKFCVRRGEQELEGLDARKVQELFCYLLLHRDHTLSREILASLLWPETTTTLSKKNLRQALWQLQSSLGSQNESLSDRVLIVEPEWIKLNPSAVFWFDVAALENAFLLVQKIPGQKLDNQKAQILHDAVQLYQGPLLEGWYQDWCIYERERLQGMYLSMLDKLMGYCEMRHDYETGLLYGMRILCYDRARERTHRRLMRLHYLNGDRAAALRQFEQCAAALDEELGVGPSKPTIALYEQIQADQLEGPVPILVSNEMMIGTTRTLEVATLPLLEVLGRLEQLQGALIDLQQQVQQSIETVEQLMACSVIPALAQSAR